VSQLVGKRLQILVVIIVSVHSLECLFFLVSPPLAGSGDFFLFPPPAPASGGELNRKGTLLKGVCQGLKKNYSTSKKT